MDTRAAICNNTQTILRLVSETIDLLSEAPASEWRTNTQQALRDTFTRTAYALGEHPESARCWKTLGVVFEHLGAILFTRRHSAKHWSLPRSYMRCGDIYDDAAGLSLRMLGLPVDADDFAFAYERPASVYVVYQIDPAASTPPIYLECAEYGESVWIPFEIAVAVANPAGIVPEAVCALSCCKLIDGALVHTPPKRDDGTDDPIVIDPLAH